MCVYYYYLNTLVVYMHGLFVFGILDRFSFSYMLLGLSLGDVGKYDLAASSDMGLSSMGLCAVCVLKRERERGRERERMSEMRESGVEIERMRMIV